MVYEPHHAVKFRADVHIKNVGYTHPKVEKITLTSNYFGLRPCRSDKNDFVDYFHAVGTLKEWFNIWYVVQKSCDSYP